MKKMITLVLTFLILSFSLLAQQYVSLYEGCNFSGRKYTLAPGSYRLNQMKVRNDRLSSMKIPAGLKVTIYGNDGFSGKSNTYSNDILCLEDEWRNMASSIVIEYQTGQPNYGQNDFITFYNDCYAKGYSQVLRPGLYKGDDLGLLKYNISSFVINGNLKVKVFINNEQLAGASASFETSQNCLTSSLNDKIGSLQIEYLPASNNGLRNNDDGYATLYADCNYEGNALRLQPGYYDGEQLGVLKFNIESIELSAGISATIYVNTENFSGNGTTISSSSNCLSSLYKNRIGAIVIEKNGISNQNNDAIENNRVQLYSDANYRGQSVYLVPGSYYSMQQAGLTDKSLSSIKVPAGLKVILFDKENFTGRNYTISSSRSSLSINGWNDKAASIIVIKE